jgi:glyceraldehyde 3-phosphate dehydrogenase
MIKIAINGFGRIGRPTFRRILEHHSNLKIVAINDLTDTKTLAHLLKYDSVYGIYNKMIKFTPNSLLIDGKIGGREVRVIAEPNPEKLPWKKLEIDIVLECTGRFTNLEGAQRHIKAGAKKVIISAPSKSQEVPTYLLGVNEEKYDPKKDVVVSMGSCTTNCVAPVVKVLNDNFKIKKGFFTTIHSYTTTQRILDLPHKDLRRARAAALNIIPTTTGAATCVEKCIPELKGKLDGIAIRVPTPTVSVTDLICILGKDVTPQEVNYTFKQVSKKERLKEILGIEDAPLVSSDYIGNCFSAIVDASFTKTDGNLVKLLAWYDNEYGYACRLADFADLMGEKM